LRARPDDDVVTRRGRAIDADANVSATRDLVVVRARASFGGVARCARGGFGARRARRVTVRAGTARDRD